MHSSRSLALAAITAASLLACSTGGGGDGPPPTAGVLVTPTEAQVRPGEAIVLSASVPGDSGGAVAWSVVEEGGGTIDANGVYTAPASLGSFHVVATSVSDPSRSGSAQLIVTDAPVVDPPVDPSAGSGISPERTTIWNPGIPGGVPARTTICATIPAATYGNGSTDATAAIQSAVNACPANQVVYLPAGTYRISGAIVLDRPVVLRGAGANATTLQPAGVAVMMGSWTQLGAGVNLTADAPKGSTAITVANPAAFAVGDVVHLDQLDDPNVVQGTACPYLKRDAGGLRSIGQMVEIAGKSGNTLTLASPLHWTFRTSLNAQLVPLSPKATKYAGLEDLKIQGGGAGAAAVNVQYAAYSWIKGVETVAVDGVHVALAGTYRFVLRDSYAHESARYSYGGNSYGYSLEWQSSDSLVENNIVRYMNKPIQFRASGGGNVVGYNYVDDSWSQPDSGGNFWFQEVSIDSHCAFSHMELVEGNYAPHMGVAATWGNAAAMTYFRNQASSVFRDMTLAGPNAPSNQSAIQLDARTFDMNVVGNVLGAPGIGARYETASGADCRTMAPYVYRLNYDSATGYCTFPSPLNTRASDTLLRNGNFDYATNAVQWAPGASQTLPASLYLTRKPAFFGSSPWPWVDPTGATKVSTLPAKARFDAGRPNG